METDGKTHPLLETDGAQDPGGVFNKAQIVQYLDFFVFKIILTVKEIHQGAKGFGVEVDGHGIDRKITAIKIELKG